MKTNMDIRTSSQNDTDRRISILLNNFGEYLHKSKVYRSNGTIYIEYTPLLYDYIDDDLDFDEMYYKNMCIEFGRWLSTVCKEILRDKGADINIIVVTENRMLFRNKEEHVVTTRYLLQDQNKIKIVCESYENV